MSRESQMRDQWDNRLVASTGDLAVFLGGSSDSFTGKLLELIAKAQATPSNFARLEAAFPREVAAWRTWQLMPEVPTFAQLREATSPWLDALRRGGPPVTYSLGQIRNGTGWAEGARFVLVTGAADAGEVAQIGTPAGGYEGTVAPGPQSASERIRVHASMFDGRVTEVVGPEGVLRLETDEQLITEDVDPVRAQVTHRRWFLDGQPIDTDQGEAIAARYLRLEDR